ncbi:hypothetical protein HKX48_008733 [Thoreauomyces humboldtii]|nr:hypothetical protein HKX48_008733 [Thoreauomyces humboldtii]
MASRWGSLLGTFVSNVLDPLSSFLVDKKVSKDWKSSRKTSSDSDEETILTTDRQCFAMVLADEGLMKEFTEFAEQSHFGENLAFYTALVALEDQVLAEFPYTRTSIQRFLNSPGPSPSPLAPLISPTLLPHFLYFHACYLAPGAITELNVSSAILARSEDVCHAGARVDVFAQAADEIIAILYFTGYRKFVESRPPPPTKSAITKSGRRERDVHAAPGPAAPKVAEPAQPIIKEELPAVRESWFPQTKVINQESLEAISAPEPEFVNSTLVRNANFLLNRLEGREHIAAIAKESKESSSPVLEPAVPDDRSSASTRTETDLTPPSRTASLRMYKNPRLNSSAASFASTRSISASLRSKLRTTMSKLKPPRSAGFTDRLTSPSVYSFFNKTNEPRSPADATGAPITPPTTPPAGSRFAHLVSTRRYPFSLDLTRDSSVLVAEEDQVLAPPVAFGQRVRPVRHGPRAMDEKVSAAGAAGHVEGSSDGQDIVDNLPSPALTEHTSVSERSVDGVTVEPVLESPVQVSA